MNNTVKSLRQLGAKCRVTHYRNTNLHAKRNSDMSLTRRFRELNEEITAKGGKTTVELTYNGKNAKGESLCSIKDSYNKKFGVTKALGRAISELNQDL